MGAPGVKEDSRGADGHGWGHFCYAEWAEQSLGEGAKGLPSDKRCLVLACVLSVVYMHV